jgi:hypothetical protein
MKQRMVRGRVSSWARLLGLVLAGVALASGCEKITEKITQKVTESAVEHAIEKQTGGEVKIDSSSKAVSFKSDKGNVEINGEGGGKIPDDFPRDVPIYPGAKVTMSMSNTSQHVLYLQTADSPEKAVEFYKAKLSAMKQETAINTEQQSMLSYRDDTGRQLQLSIGKEEGGTGPNTMIALIVNPAKKPAAAQ